MRHDLQVIASWIEEGAKVLDLGCGQGELMACLRDEKQARCTGIDMDEANVSHCIGQGLIALQGDINEEIRDYPDKSFDYVVLSQTLQQVYSPGAIIAQMLRVGRRGIVSFPNFGHWRIRLQLLLTGRAPTTRELPYQWHDTPNIRVVTLRDFRRFCRERSFPIAREAAITTCARHATGRELRCMTGLRAKFGIFQLGEK